jgi:hypothetical protein
MHYMGGHLEKNLSLYICPIITTKFVWLTITVENLLLRELLVSNVEYNKCCTLQPVIP